MIEDRSVMEKMYEIEHNLNNNKQYKMHMNETTVVSSKIDKLSSSPEDFKRSMKHKKKRRHLS